MPADSSVKELLDGLTAGKLDDDAQRQLLAKARIPEASPDHRVDPLGHPVAGATKSYFGMNAAERISYLEHTCEFEEYLLKPMNCPHHIQIYASLPRSYRELPLRLAEFGTVYRYEQSGELSGLTRVRGFTQDDAHLFCTNEQVRGEFRSTMEMTQFFLNSCLGLSDYRVRLSKSDPTDPKYQGAAGDTWRRAEDDIRSVLEEMNLPYEEAAGEAAFYGPKADFIVRDCIGRQWQLGTVQLDYVLPERFDLNYVGPDNQLHRPVMIHRAPLGSMERFMGILIEHFAGAFPLWLAPEQVRVLPISEKVAQYADAVLASLREAGFRATADLRPEKIGSKIRDAQLEKIPVMLVVGAKEAESMAVSYRDRTTGDQGAMPLADAITRLRSECDSRRAQPSQPIAVTAPTEEKAEDHTY
jgi:threonyl-tRNA synthetase